MFKCFAWLNNIIIESFVLRHVGYWRDDDGTLYDVAIRPNGERELIHTYDAKRLEFDATASRNQIRD